MRRNGIGEGQHFQIGQSGSLGDASGQTFAVDLSHVPLRPITVNAISLEDLRPQMYGILIASYTVGKYLADQLQGLPVEDDASQIKHHSTGPHAATTVTPCSLRARPISSPSVHWRSGWGHSTKMGPSSVSMVSSWKGPK